MKFNDYDPKIIFSKGYVESTLSRPMVDFMINQLNLTEMMRRIELKGFGIDEIMVRLWIGVLRITSTSLMTATF